jgi:hypothetical protein
MEGWQKLHLLFNFMLFLTLHPSFGKCFPHFAVGMHKYRAPGRSGDQIFDGGSQYFRHTHCSFSPNIQNVCQFTGTEHKAPYKWHSQFTSELRFPGMELAPYLLPGDYNLNVASRLLENLWTPAYIFISSLLFSAKSNSFRLFLCSSQVTN